MEIVTAKPTDIDLIMDFIDKARKIMWNTGNKTQWPDNYPTQATIEKDIHTGNCRLCMEDGTAVASFTIMAGPDKSYATINSGQWIDDTLPYHVVHRIASDGSCHGVFNAVIDYCSKINNNIRIDTHRDNSIMRHCLMRHGFTYCGIIHVEDGTERLAFQRIIK